jgi:hypothetical protein
MNELILCRRNKYRGTFISNSCAAEAMGAKWRGRTAVSMPSMAGAGEVVLGELRLEPVGARFRNRPWAR